MTAPFHPAVGLVMDPWRFDPAATVKAANRVIRAGPGAPALLREWASQAPRLEDAMAAVIVTLIAVEPVPIYGRIGFFRSDAPSLPHHPFVLWGDVPFLPIDAMEVGAAMMAPADFIETCFRQGALLKAPLVPQDPFHAAFALLSSQEWIQLIVPQALTLASRPQLRTLHCRRGAIQWVVGALRSQLRE